MKRIIAVLCLFALSAFADDDELSNAEIMKEIKEGHSTYKPNHIIFNVKPISFIVGQSLRNPAPYPMKCLQVHARLIGNLGVQAEPVFIIGGHGGYGFTVGPSYFPEFAWDEVHLTGKYELDYINRMGAYHGFMLELSRHRLFKFFVLTYGGAVGFGVTGASASAGFSGETRILEVRQGLAYDVNLGLGFAL